LRDATGLVDFNDFLNQIEYANAATELNNKVKSDVLAGFDAKGAEGKTVSFVGAFAYGSNPAVIQVTPVELEAT
jgi:predicted lipoprotein